MKTRKQVWQASLGIRIILVLTLGIAYVSSTLAPGFLFGDGAYWSGVASDRASNLVGYLYYLEAPWQWPPFRLDQLSLPEGTSVIYSDSIPLVSLLAKAANSIYPNDFIFFGFWIGACYLLNGIAFLLVLDRLGVRDPLISLLGALLAMLTPVLLQRWYHAGLNAHFLILLSLALYFAIATSDSSRRILTLQVALVVIALLIHPYIMAIVFSILFATVLKAAWIGKLSWQSGALWVLIGGMGVVIIALATGFIEPGMSPEAAGFRHFSTNLLSFIQSLQSGLRPSAWELAERAALEQNTWVFFGQSYPDATGGQYEGAGYLGAGVMMLAVVIMLLLRRNALRQVARQWPLVMVTLALLLFALSSLIYAGSRLLVQFELPAWTRPLTDSFRASGRFSWLFVYVLLVFVVVNTARRFQANTAAAMLMVAVTLQWIDTAALRQVIWLSSNLPEHAGLDASFWEETLEEAEMLYLAPSYACGDSGLRSPKIQLHVLAARLGPIPTNSAYVARDKKDCEAEIKHLQQFGLEPGAVYAFFDDFRARPALVEFVEAQDANCQPFRRGVMCRHD